jgi:nucleoside-specific outer membrane channel protein Tsx
MPDIKFFSPYQLNQDYTYKSPDKSRIISFGGYQFTLTRAKPIYELIHGAMCFVGYEETYSNSEISQEEADRVWKQYLEETGQLEE